MKAKFILVNSSVVILFTGLLSTIAVGSEVGAILVLVASSGILATYVLQIIQLYKQRKLWSFDNLAGTLALLAIAVIFIHAFSFSIGLPFLGNLPGFSSVYLGAGIILIGLFLVYNIRFVQTLDAGKSVQLLFVIILSIASVTSLLGLFSLAGVLAVSVWLSTYSLVGTLVTYLILSILLLPRKEKKVGYGVSAFLTGIMILFIIARFNSPQMMSQGMVNAIVTFGFVPVILLPLSIFYVKRFYIISISLLYFVFLDIYFIHTNGNFNYLVNVGTNECVGYEDATVYPVNTDPGISLDELFREPSEMELNAILAEWQEKDFTPVEPQIVYEEELSNGDIIQVLAHRVNGNLHYGLIRIPSGIDVSSAPILMGLMGGGTGMDVLTVDDIFRLASSSCRDALHPFISIMPSFRGDVVRGENFCFRSEGYAGDVWLGPAEDAIAFLEAVKELYNKAGGTKVLAQGVSRGATVALIIGGLTDKLDYIIATLSLIHI